MNLDEIKVRFLMGSFFKNPTLTETGDTLWCELEFNIANMILLTSHIAQYTQQRVLNKVLQTKNVVVSFSIMDDSTDASNVNS